LQLEDPQILGAGNYEDLASKIKVLKVLFEGFESVLHVVDAGTFFYVYFPPLHAFLV